LVTIEEKTVLLYFGQTFWWNDGGIYRGQCLC